MRLKNILDYKIVMELFQFSRQSWNNWKKENRPIVLLIEKYFTNQDLQEFLDTGKISKFENVERLPEILKILTKYTTKDLRVFLAKSYSDNDVLSGAYARLVKYSEYAKEDKFDVLKDIDYLLYDVIDEIQRKDKDTPFQDILVSFNKSIGFDFNENDIPVIRQIMSRYEVYNTLYDLDKTPIKN